MFLIIHIPVGSHIAPFLYAPCYISWLPHVPYPYKTPDFPLRNEREYKVFCAMLPRPLLCDIFDAPISIHPAPAFRNHQMTIRQVSLQSFSHPGNESATQSVPQPSCGFGQTVPPAAPLARLISRLAPRIRYAFNFSP